MLLALALVLAAPCLLVASPADASHLGPSISELDPGRDARPTVTSVTPAQGPVTGGTRLTIRGKNLSKVRSVRIGTVVATHLTHVTPQRVVLTTPAGYPGRAPVQVVDRAGHRSALRSAPTFRYAVPPAQDQSDLTMKAGTVSLDPDEVLAVSDAPTTPSDAGSLPAWTIDLDAGASSLAVGRTVVLVPDNEVFPAGLSGIVAESTAKPDGTTRITVNGAPLDETFDGVDIAYTGRVPDLSTDMVGFEDTRAFRSIPTSAFDCQRNGRGGGSAHLSGGVELAVTDIQTHFELRAGGLFQRPFVDVWVSYKTTLAAGLSVDTAAKCKLSALWANNHSRITPLGTSGATLAVVPNVEFSVSAGVEVKLARTTYHMQGFITNPDGSIRSLHGQSADPLSFTVGGRIKFEGFAGFDIKVGALNVIGVGISAGLGVDAEAGLYVPPTRLCAEASTSIQVKLFAFLNVWIKEWKLQSFKIVVPLAGGEQHCTPSTGTALTRDLLQLVNQARSSSRWCGQVQYPAVAPLTEDSRLMRSADKFATLMASQNFFSHSSPNGDGPAERAADEGFLNGVGENIAAGYDGPADVVDTWLGSPGHCEVIMTSDEVAGIGYAFNRDSEYGTYWVLDGQCLCANPSSVEDGPAGKETWWHD